MQWCALISMQGKEFVLESALQEKQFESYCPVIRRRRIVRNRDVFSKLPLYRGYVFVRLDLACGWVAARYANGARKFVTKAGSDGMPATLSDDFIEAHRRQGDLYEGMPEPLRPGDLVRVIGSPVEDLPLRVSKLDAQGRVFVLMQMFGGEREVRVARSAVEKVRIAIS